MDKSNACRYLEGLLISYLLIQAKSLLSKTKRLIEATRDEKLTKYYQRANSALQLHRAQTPPKKTIKGSIPAVTSSAETYAARPYVEANEDLLSQMVKTQAG